MKLNPSINLCSSSNKNKKLSASADDLSEEYRTKHKEPYDVVLIAGIDDDRLSAHWDVISRHSAFFEAAFNSNLEEVNTGEIELEEFDGKTLKCILDFMYSVPTELDCKTVESVLVAADFLQINTLVNACCDFISESLETSNCLSIHLFSEQHLHLPLRNKTYEFVYAYFEEVCTEKDFLQLNEEQLVKFISNDCRYVRSEENLYLSLVAWVEHDKQNREKLLLKLMNHIDFRRIDLKFFYKHWYLVPQTEYINCWSQWLLASHCKTDTSLVKVNDIETRQINKLVRAKTNEPFEVHTFNPELSIWFAEKWPLPSIEKISLVAVVNKMLVVSNDHTFQYLDLETMKFTELPQTYPKFYKMFESKGDLYKIGRHCYGKHSSLKKYNFLTRQWKWVTELPLDVECVTVHDGLIYASVFDNTSRCLECYDPTADKWTSIALRKCQKFTIAMAGMGEYLYLIVNRHNTRVDRYHPSTNSWTEIGSLGHEFLYSDTGCIVFNKRLLIFEQNFSSPDREIVVKEYNSVTNQITSLPSLPKSSILFTI